MNKGSRKKSKINVKHLVSTLNVSIADMAQAVTNLAEILKPEGDSNGEIEGFCSHEYERSQLQVWA